MANTIVQPYAADVLKKATLEKELASAIVQIYAADVLKKAARDHHSMDADDRQTLLSFLSSPSEYAPQSGQLTGILKTMQDREGKIRA